jgi:transcriptional regulator with XRE-family HTH domain
MPDKLIVQLETYRLDHKITQEDLADRLGVAFSTVNRWLNDKNKPSKIQTHQIKKLLSKVRAK